MPRNQELAQSRNSSKKKKSKRAFFCSFLIFRINIFSWGGFEKPINNNLPTKFQVPEYLIDQLLTTIILGLIQGFAEWLPISSTAHLRVAEHFLGFQATPLFNVILHVGTLGVVIFYFRHDIKVVLTALVHRDFHSEYGRFIPLIVVATIPTGIIGLLYDKFLADNYQTLLIIGVTFLIGAALLFASKYGKENQNQITYRKALRYGCSARSCQLSRAVKKRLHNIKRVTSRRQTRDGF